MGDRPIARGKCTCAAERLTAIVMSLLLASAAEARGESDGEHGNRCHGYLRGANGERAALVRKPSATYLLPNMHACMDSSLDATITIRRLVRIVKR